MVCDAVYGVSVGVPFERVVAVQGRDAAQHRVEVVERALPVSDSVIGRCDPLLLHHVLVEQEHPREVERHEVQCARGGVELSGDLHFVIQRVVPPRLLEIELGYRSEVGEISFGRDGGVEVNREISGVIVAVSGHNHLGDGLAHILLSGLPRRGVRLNFAYLAVEPVLNPAVAGVNGVVELFAGLLLEVHPDGSSRTACPGCRT